jgi:hypothetical protein
VAAKAKAFWKTRMVNIGGALIVNKKPLRLSEYYAQQQTLYNTFATLY